MRGCVGACACVCVDTWALYVHKCRGGGGVFYTQTILTMAAPSKFTKRIQFYQRLRYKEVGQLGSTLGKRGGIGALPGRHGQHTRVPGWGDSIFTKRMLICDYILGLLQECLGYWLIW